MKKQLYAAIIVALLSVGMSACSKSEVQKGSFQELTYEDAVVSSSLKNEIVTTAQNYIWNYTSFSGSVYSSTKTTNISAQEEQKYDGKKDDSTYYVTVVDKTNSTTAGVTIKNTTTTEYKYYTSGSVNYCESIVDSKNTHEETKTQTVDLPNHAAINSLYSLLANPYNGLNGSMVKTKDGYRLIKSLINENHSFVQLGNEAKEVITIQREQTIVDFGQNDDVYFIKSISSYTDSQTNRDPETNAFYSKIQEVGRFYCQMTIKY